MRQCLCYVKVCEPVNPNILIGGTGSVQCERKGLKSALPFKKVVLQCETSKLCRLLLIPLSWMFTKKKVQR